jgi:hypothetical protein
MIITFVALKISRINALFSMKHIKLIGLRNLSSIVIASIVFLLFIEQVLYFTITVLMLRLSVLYVDLFNKKSGGYIVDLAKLLLIILCLSTVLIVLLSGILLYKYRHRNGNIIKNKVCDRSQTELHCFLIDVSNAQYNSIIKILCDYGKVPKTKKSNYDGANRDSVSNFLIALNHCGKMEFVCRENVHDIVKWLENINGLDAHFSENIDDFLEKFTYVSDLRQRRISAIEIQLEKLGINQ